MASTELLRIFGKASPVTVLGPADRAVIWVQGCTRQCAGCSAPESWDMQGGYEVLVDCMADWVLHQQGVEGLTISGGEPMLQAASLCCLVDLIRERLDIGLVCYTGYQVEELISTGTPSQRELLGRTDLLIDGAYDVAQHASLLWRGSANQRLIQLSNRYAGILDALDSVHDVSAGLQFFVEEGGNVGYAGVPAVPGFHDEFKRRLSEREISLSAEREGVG